MNGVLNSLKKSNLSIMVYKNDFHIFCWWYNKKKFLELNKILIRERFIRHHCESGYAPLLNYKDSPFKPGFELPLAKTVCLSWKMKIWV